MAFSQNAVQVEVLSTDDGLNFRHVNTIAQDADGFMWFGTRQGIAKYDGNIFKVFDNSKNNHNFIPFEVLIKVEYQKSNNTLWFIANHKLFRLNLETETLDEIEDENGFLKNEVLEIAFDKTDNLWIVTDEFNSDQTKIQTLLKYNGKSFQFIKSLERQSAGFTALDITNSNEICWTTINHGLTLFDQNGKVLKNKKLDTFDWYGYTIHYGESFMGSNNQHYYFPESKGGIDVYNNLEFSHRLLDDKAIFFNATEDRYGGIWFSGKKELFYLNASGDLYDYTKNIAQSIDFSNINCLFIDDSNLLWLGTDNGLIKVKLKPQNFKQILKVDESSWGRTFRSIFPLQGGDIAAMCESENQLYRINSKGDATPILLPDGSRKLKDARFFVADTQNNKAYTVTNFLIEIDFNTNSLTTYGNYKLFLNETKPNPIIRLADGRLLTGYKFSKLIFIDPETKAFKPVLLEPPTEDYEIKTLIQSNINPEIIWVGTSNQGLLKVNLNGILEAEYNISSVPSLNKNSILSLYEIDNQLLIGTFGGGINILDLGKNTIKVIDKEDGLSDNNVVSILSTGTKDIVAATYNGISTFNIKTNNHHNYFVEDGLTNNEFNYTSAYKDAYGNFYFGGLNGINKFEFEELSQEYTLPKVNFTRFEVYNQRDKTTTQITKMNEGAILLTPYDQHFKIDWSIPDYFNKNNYTYYTKLEGFENEWFYQGNQNSIRYNKLPAGDYVLKVKGMDSNGNESRAALSIPIQVKQIFYKKWWFITLIILSVFGVMYVVFQYRLNQALAMERLRTKISSDLHDDVGSMLTGLAMQTEMLEMQATNSIDKNRLHQITTLSRNTISHMRDLVWSIDSRRDTMGDLIERMRELAEELLLPSNISYDFQTDDLNLQKKLDLNCRRNLFLIYKEAITNIVKHSNANNVTINIINKNGACNLSIKDDGLVKNFENCSGLGLANMKLRCDSIKAKLEFDLNNGFGINVSLPHSI
ncbi:two-component system sensor with a ligand-binding domain protein [Paucihalobacter ruber]|uniref:histidine kinase n=1 Tax=Paucihalobacter ruber TaxID=2567861 RepID=A0A506PIC0_9FLAO|nr:triple tyrosine motif-containing protein [Paucihalobacter ruber]TPV32827.1 two-component system sensor with a ligand-binding domain protein [Paucihalobacter ruber]